jgi:hypothetical protein
MVLFGLPRELVQDRRVLLDHIAEPLVQLTDNEQGLVSVVHVLEDLNHETPIL